MVYLFMFLSSVVIFESFNASYTSFLSVVSQATPFETLGQLEQTNFVVGAMIGNPIQTMFRVGHKTRRSSLILLHFSQ